MEGSPGSHTQGRRTLTSFPEMRPGQVVKGAEVVNDFRFYLYAAVQLWHSMALVAPRLH